MEIHIHVRCNCLTFAAYQFDFDSVTLRYVDDKPKKSKDTPRTMILTIQMLWEHKLKALICSH